MKKHIITVAFALLIMATSLVQAAGTSRTPGKRMQIGAPFTLVLELNPTGAPVKADSVLSVGNRILLGHSKNDFTWYIARTPNKWVKLASGAAVLGFPVKIALSYDGQTMRSYYNSTLVGSLPVSAKQFTGLMPIKLNDWLGSYRSAVAYAKSLSQLQIESSAAPTDVANSSSATGNGSVGNDTSTPNDANDPTQPTDIEPVKPTDGKPVEPQPADPTQPTDVKPVEPKPADPTQPTDVKPVEPQPADPTLPTDVKPVEPQPADPTQPTDAKPVEPQPADPTQPTDVKPVEPQPADVKPVKPVPAPTNPTPVKPVKPGATKPVEPAKPVVVAPVKPVKPTAPSMPDPPADLGTSSVKQITVTVKVLAITTTPEPDKILPYKHAIITHEVEVLSIDNGSMPNIKKGDKLRIARWGILQGQKTAVAKVMVGDTLTLPLENYKDHEELERQYTVDTLPESYELPYMLDVSE